jgi:hypothetical protein
MKIRTMMFVALLVMSGQGVNANYYGTGGELLNLCESELMEEYGRCTGYLAGKLDMHELFFEFEVLPVKYYCIPEGATLGQLKKVFIKYANENPQDLHIHATRLVGDAFRDAFPCE